MGKSNSPCFYGCGGPLLLLLLLLPSQEVGGGGVRIAEARVCQSQSHGFHGSCVSHHNCALVCRHEGFSGGRCRGFRHRCFCTKVC